MLHLLPEEKKLKYPNWLLITFAFSVTSLMASMIGVIFDLIIMISIWAMPGYALEPSNSFVFHWFGISMIVVTFCIWKAVQIDKR